MRNMRLAATLTTLSVVASLSTLGAAHAAIPTGVGTSKTVTTLLSVQLGTNGALLSLGLDADEGRSTIDPAVATPEAYSKLAALSVSSASVPALSAIGTPAATTFESRQPGGNPSVTTASVDFGTAASAVPGIIGGTLNVANLKSAVDATTGATSQMLLNVSNLDLVSGLLHVNGLGSTLGTNASPTAATTSRAVSVDQVAVLNLGALLAALKIDVATLPLPTLSQLLTTLGATLPGHPDLAGYVTTLQGEIAALNTAIGTAVLGVVAVIPQGVSDALATAGINIPVLASATVATLTGAVSTLNALLGAVINQGIAALANVTLLSIDGVHVGIATSAADTVAHSAAATTASIGGVKVAGATVLSGVDLLSTKAAADNLVAGVGTNLTTALAPLAIPLNLSDLAGLVSVKVLTPDAGNGVSASDGYTHAVSGITAMTVTVTPPSALAAAVAALSAGVGSVGAALTAAGQTVTPLSPAMNAVNTALGGTVGALGAGGNINIAHLGGTSDFAVGAGSTSGGNPLAATGDSNLRLMGLALLLVALGLGFRTWFADPIRTNS